MHPDDTSLTERLFTPAEAAAICGLKSFDVQNAIDRRIVGAVWKAREDRAGDAGPRNSGLFLNVEGLVWLQIWRSIGETLSLAHRQSLWAALSEAPLARWVRITDLLIVDVETARNQVAARIAELAAAEAIIAAGEGELAGEFVFKDSQTLVYPLVARIKSGVTAEDILKGEPRLSREVLDLGLLWATAHPRRGRPTLLSRKAQRIQ